MLRVAAGYARKGYTPVPVVAGNPSGYLLTETLRDAEGYARKGYTPVARARRETRLQQWSHRLQD